MSLLNDVVRVDGPPQQRLADKASAFRHCVVLRRHAAVVKPGLIRLQPLGTPSQLAEMFRLCFADESPINALLAVEPGGIDGHFRRLVQGAFGQVDSLFSGMITADASGAAIAVAIVTRRDGFLWYAWLMVSPSHQGQGLGSRLLLNPLTGGEELRLCVDANSRQHLHYQRLGFAPTGEEYTKYILPKLAAQRSE